MAESVKIDSLSKRFAGGNLAMDHVSLAIDAGELFFLLGPSGCGKTTLLRSIAGFCQPDEGSIFIGTRNISALAPHRRETGMVFQSYALWPHMTVRQNVAFGLDMRKLPSHEKQQRTENALEMVRMLDRADAKPNALSGGQQQRVALARALVIEPKCLLLDEPLSNLDAKLRLDMRQEIRNISKRAGITTIYVTHDQKEALSVADRMAVMDRGKVLQVGTPSEIYRQPTSLFVAGFIGETNILKATIVTQDNRQTTLDTEMGIIQSVGIKDKHTPPGTSVMVSIRPEAIRLGDSAAAGPNRIRGKCRRTTYLGELAQHEIEIRTGLTVKAYEINPRGQHLEDVTLTISPEDTILLPSS